MDKLPKGWELIELSSLCEFENGDRGKNYPSKSSFVDSGVPFINAGNLSNNKVDTINLNYISEAHYNKLSNGKLKYGDIVFCLRGSLGKFAVVDRELKGAIASSLVIVRPKENLDLSFLSAYFQSSISKKYIDLYDNGSAQPNLSAASLRKFKIPLPPLLEQKRIVSKLDALFKRIDKSMVFLEENITHTESLMASALDEVFGEIDQEKFLPLLEICSPSKETLIPIDNEEYNYVGLENIQSNTGRIINFSRTEGKNIKSTKVRFKRGAVLYGKLRPYLNKVYVADFNGIATTEIMPFQTRKDLLNASFLAYFLRSPRFVALVNQYTSGARMPRATTTFFKKVAKVPVIPLNSQEKIVKKLDSYSKSIEGLLQEQKAKLNHLKSLKESILDKAFKGEI